MKVLDGDTWGSDDFVDDLRKQFMVTPGRSPGQGQTVSGEISHRTTLVLELNAHCNGMIGLAQTKVLLKMLNFEML